MVFTTPFALLTCFMNQESKPSTSSSAPVADPNAVCDECGAYGAFDFVDVKLCVQCYTEKGSCCAESGKDDLWKNRTTEFLVETLNGES